MAFDLPADYKQVPERIADFKAKHPEGSLRAANPLQPYAIEVIDGQTYIIYTAAAFRTPDDPAPGIGIAWEPVPGRTPYTKLSELQNAETSAWGRAIVAVLASESKSIASAEDVRNRRADHDAPIPARQTSTAASGGKIAPELRDRATEFLNANPARKDDFVARFGSRLPAKVDASRSGEVEEFLGAASTVNSAEGESGAPKGATGDSPAQAPALDGTEPFE